MATKHILIIDDEKTIQTVVQLSLELAAGWNTLTADSGREGLHKAKIGKPDAILLDVMMPEMDGLLTLEHLQSHSVTQSIPVIFLTAISPPKQLSLTEMGAAGVIAKPFNPLTLAYEMAEMLNWPLPVVTEAGM